MDYRRMAQMTEIFRDGKIHPLEQLEAELNLGNRMVRKLLGELNQELLEYQASICAKRGEGYYLLTENEQLFRQFEEKLRRINQQSEELPNSAQERIRFLIGFLLRTDDYVKMDMLCDQLYVSRRALSEDLKEVRGILQDYSLELEQRPNYGLRIRGEERAIRRCMADFAGEKADISVLLQTQEENSLGKIAEIVAACLEREEIRISDVAFQNLIGHIYIALQRIRRGHSVPTLEPETCKKDSREYRAALEIASAVNRQYEMTFPDSEINYIAIHLAGKRIYGEQEEPQNLVITQEVSELVTEMLQSVYDLFRQDLRGDLELRMALSQHLVPLLVRIRYGMTMKNPLLKDIKEQFSFAYVMAAQACGIVNLKYKTELSEDEIGYIALAFALALERKKHRKVKKNILLVCSSGKGSAQMLLYQYREKFGEYLNRIETCDSQSLSKMDLSGFDYIFTTVPIPMKVPIPIQEVRFFFEEQEVRKIRRMLSDGGIQTIEKYFPRELFFEELALTDKDSVLRFLCSQANAAGLAPEELYQAVMEREALAVTAFGNFVAMPHPNYSVSEETFVSVAVLKDRIDWGNQEVQAVFLVSIEKRANKELQLFYQTLSRFLMNDMYVKSLIKKPDYEALLDRLKWIELEIENGGR